VVGETWSVIPFFTFYFGRGVNVDKQTTASYVICLVTDRGHDIFAEEEEEEEEDVDEEDYLEDDDEEEEDASDFEEEVKRQTKRRVSVNLYTCIFNNFEERCAVDR
jgi:hypothetical protein